MKKKIRKFETPAIHKNENDSWHDTCKRTAEKFNRVQITTSNPKIDIEKYKKNYNKIKWTTH